jgi:hypothetical protein
MQTFLQPGEAKRRRHESGDGRCLTNLPAKLPAWLLARATAPPHHTDQAQGRPMGAPTPPVAPQPTVVTSEAKRPPLALSGPGPLAAPSPAISMSFGVVRS